MESTSPNSERNLCATRKTTSMRAISAECWEHLATQVATLLAEALSLAATPAPFSDPLLAMATLILNWIKLRTLRSADRAAHLVRGSGVMLTTFRMTGSCFQA